MIPIQTVLFVGKIEYLSVLRQRLDICVEQCGLPRRAGTGQVWQSEDSGMWWQK